MDSKRILQNKTDTGTSRTDSNSSMYRMKPFDLSQTIELPHGMYRVIPVSFLPDNEPASGSTTAVSTSTSRKVVGTKSGNVPVEKFGVIEKRQLEILEKLTNLREIIVGIHEKYVTDDDNTNNDTEADQDSLDIVVNANPNTPPFSLLFLHKLLQQYYGKAVQLRNHLHSSVTGPLHEYLSIFSTLEKSNESSPVLFKITLIWKDTDDIELMVDPLSQSKVLGEGNLARFLSRLIPAVFPLNYDSLDWNTMSLVDGFISQALDESTFNLQMVEGYLKGRKHSGGPFLLGGISIADFITFSAVSRELLKDLNTISLAKFPNVRKWIDSCQQYGEFELFGY